MCPRVRVPNVTARGAATSAGPAGVVAVGEAALEAQQAGLKLIRPVVGGVVQHWEDLEALWRHVFRDRLKVRVCACACALALPRLE